MTFTDDDLKRLKEELKDWNRPDLQALLARLEAAEAVCELAELEVEKRLELNEGYYDEAVKAWRKFCGKAEK